MKRFIRIQSRIIHLDGIAYVDFPDSGRAVIFMRGLSMEKQNIPVDPQDAVLLRRFLERECLELAG